MTSFVDAVNAQEARTENGMKAFQGSLDACVDLFYKIGATRGQDQELMTAFLHAAEQEKDVALRIAAWGRDVRGGAGERQHFRNILQYLELNDVASARRLMKLAPEVGRWDDLLVLKSETLKSEAFKMIGEALRAGNGLCAKWMPRKGVVAFELRQALNMSPKQYRKTLVSLTKVVEQQMCAQDWSNINFNHVPSLASIRYKKAFQRNATEQYTAWANKLAAGSPDVKVNAGAVYPYQVLGEFIHSPNVYSSATVDQERAKVALAQWEALPNYLSEGASILPLVDVSGSMSAPCNAKGAKETCMEVAVSLGVYLAEKNTGNFKDLALTFSESPQLLKLTGNAIDKCSQMLKGNWGMSTNLHAAFNLILNTAVKGKVPQGEMPNTLLILSDMQFDACVTHDDSALEMMSRKYREAGYEMPNVVFWNLRDAGNMPSRATAQRVALVSGFSPAIVQSVLGGQGLTPRDVMLSAVMIDRYSM